MKPKQIKWHEKYGKEIPICRHENCENTVKWNGSKYRKFCSTKCSNSSIEKQAKEKQTNLKRYGNTNPNLVKEIREKIKQTNFEKFGVEYAMQSEEIKEKIKQNNLKKYGVESTLQIETLIQKRKQTCIEKYGVENPSQRSYTDEQKEILFNQDNFAEFIKDKTSIQAMKKLNVDKTTILSYIEKYDVEYIQNKSYLEQEMFEFLQEYGINFIQNTRKIIPPYELDFYLPDYQIAIEMNGDYWHSDEMILETKGMTADEYHQMKTDRCFEQGIELIHISESDWNLNPFLNIENRNI